METLSLYLTKEIFLMIDSDKNLNGTCHLQSHLSHDQRVRNEVAQATTELKYELHRPIDLYCTSSLHPLDSALRDQFQTACLYHMPLIRVFPPVDSFLHLNRGSLVLLSSCISLSSSQYNSYFTQKRRRCLQDLITSVM